MKKLLVVLTILLLTNACHVSSKNKALSVEQIPLELLGTFKDDYGSSYVISKSEWVQDGHIKYHLLTYNKEEKFFIAKNGKDNPFEANLFSRIDIIYFENFEPWRWGYCMTNYKATSMQEAIHTAAADRLNPRNGCNGYPFSRMKRE